MGCSKTVYVPVEVPIKYGNPQAKPTMTKVGTPVLIKTQGAELTCYTEWQITNIAANIILLEQWGESNYKQMVGDVNGTNSSR